MSTPAKPGSLGGVSLRGGDPGSVQVGGQEDGLLSGVTQSLPPPASRGHEAQFSSLCMFVGMLS